VVESGSLKSCSTRKGAEGSNPFLSTKSLRMMDSNESVIRGLFVVLQPRTAIQGALSKIHTGNNVDSSPAEPSQYPEPTYL
jgi:hypothetical protein